jgi:hypothetical protein
MVHDLVLQAKFMAKTVITTPKSALARVALDEIADDERAHRLRAASWKFERRLHDIRSAAFEAEAAARSDYLAEVEAINGDEGG